MSFIATARYCSPQNIPFRPTKVNPSMTAWASPWRGGFIRFSTSSNPSRRRRCYIVRAHCRPLITEHLGKEIAPTRPRRATVAGRTGEEKAWAGRKLHFRSIGLSENAFSSKTRKVSPEATNARPRIGNPTANDTHQRNCKRIRATKVLPAIVRVASNVYCLVTRTVLESVGNSGGRIRCANQPQFGDQKKIARIEQSRWEKSFDWRIKWKFDSSLILSRSKFNWSFPRVIREKAGQWEIMHWNYSQIRG